MNGMSFSRVNAITESQNPTSGAEKVALPSLFSLSIWEADRIVQSDLQLPILSLTLERSLNIIINAQKKRKKKKVVHQNVSLPAQETRRAQTTVLQPRSAPPGRHTLVQDQTSSLSIIFTCSPPINPTPARRRLPPPSAAACVLLAFPVAHKQNTEASGGLWGPRQTGSLGSEMLVNSTKHT